MKICPTCNARCFDDMELCYGCLHDFNKHFGTTAASDHKSSLLERDWDIEQDWDIDECLEFDCASDRKTGIEKSYGNSGHLLDGCALPSPLEERIKSGEGPVSELAGKAAGSGKEKREVTIRIELDPGKARSVRNAETSPGSMRHAVGIPMLTVVGKTDEEGERIAQDGAVKNEDDVAVAGASDGREADFASFEGRCGKDALVPGEERAACCVTISVA
ncbi:MAG: hypothetical protein ACLTQI_04855 [Slackia sp.]